MGLFDVLGHLSIRGSELSPCAGRKKAIGKCKFIPLKFGRLLRQLQCLKFCFFTLNRLVSC